MEEISKRELAFCYIYSQEIQEQNSRNQVKLFLDCQEVEDPRVREYVKDMARGIKENNEEITGKISQNLKKGWTIDRLSTVDLAILKLAIYEIEYKKIWRGIIFIICKWSACKCSSSNARRRQKINQGLKG